MKAPPAFPEPPRGYRLKPSAVLLCVALPLGPLFALISLFAYGCLVQVVPLAWWQAVLYWAALAALYVSNVFSVARLFAHRILSGEGIVVNARPQEKGGSHRG